MTNWINPLINEYYDWLKSNTMTRSDLVTGWTLIETPFVGLFNDNIEIYARKNGDNITLSDNGDTLNNLELTGVAFNRSKERRAILNNILLNYGVKLANKELIVECRDQDFKQKKHNLLNCLIELNDLYVLSNHTISSIFKEDVQQYLNENQIIYTKDFTLKGSTGLDFIFDFQIAKMHSEIVIKSFSRIHKNALTSFLFSWEDIKPARERVAGKKVKAIAVLNDPKPIDQKYIEALQSKEADCIIWSQRSEERNLLKLAA